MADDPSLQPQAPIPFPEIPSMSGSYDPYAAGYSTQAPQQARPAITTPAQHVINALRLGQPLPVISPVPQAVVKPAYAAPVANLNPNLPKAAARVQQVATGISKPTAADWGR